MYNLSKIVSYPFYIYDLKKFHGYIYSSFDSLYHLCDKYNVKKHIPQNNPFPEIINKDLRPIMDMANNKIPIGNDLIYIPSTKNYRIRTEDDYFTYSIDDSINQVGVDINPYMNLIIPSNDDRILLRNHIITALSTHIIYDPNIKQIPNSSYLLIHGCEKSAEMLFNILSKLDPLITKGKISLYCETNVSKTVLTQIKKSRIVLCNIKQRTIRVAQPPNKPFEHPIQYHGIIYQDIVNYDITLSKHNNSDFISLCETDFNIGFTAGDILKWVLS